MTVNCKHPDCILSIWPEAENYCFFHEPRRDAIIAGHSGHNLQNALHGYLINASNPNHPPKRNGGLVLAGVRFDAQILSALPPSVNRSLEFVSCVFGNLRALWGRTYGGMLFIVNCSSLTDDAESTELVLDSCIFGDGIEIEARLPVVLRKCQSRSKIKIRSDQGTSIEGGTLGGTQQVTIDCSGDLRIRGVGTVTSPIEIPAGPRTTEISDCKLMGEAILRVSAGSKFVRLANVTIGTRLLMTSDLIVNCPSPTIVLDNVTAPSQFDCPKLSFRNIGVGRVNGIGLRFSGSLEIENVHFEHSWSRKVFAAERDTRLPFFCFKRFRNDLERLQRWREDYRWLKKWYNERQDHQTSNAFYASEMFATWKVEVSRASLLRAVWKRYLSFDAWYCRLSNFGQSVIRPVGWVAASFVITAIVVSGLGMFVEPFSENVRRTVDHSFSNGLEFALRSFAFWFRPEGRPYLTPATTLGWIAGLTQQSITLIAGTFFLLALRRRFKR